MGVRRYRVLDLDLRLESSSEAFLEAFHEDYARFASAGPGGRPLAVRFEAGPGAFLEVDGLRTDLSGHPSPEGQAALDLAQLLMDRNDAYTILHAGVVGSPRGAMAVCGPSGAGKTTLTLALLEAGCAYLSDDFCPVARDTGLVHPFPRSLWVRARPGQASSNRRKGKLLHPLDGAAFPVETRPRPLRWLLCLEAEGLGEAPSRLRLALREGRGEELLAALRGLEGVNVAPTSTGPEWLVTYPRQEGLTAAVKACLDAHPGALWHAYAQATAEPDFSREAALEPLSAAEAAFFLLRELKHGLGGARPGAALGHLVGLLGATECYRLTPGPLPQRLALARGLLEGEEHP